MNKKTFIALAVCALTAPAALLFTGCGKHDHTFSTDWTKNATEHWHACTSKDCDATKDKALHVYDDNNDADCNTCGYVRVAVENTLTFNVQPKTFDGTAQGLVQGTDFSLTDGIATVKYKAKDADDSTYTTTAPILAGEYTAKVEAEGNAVYISAQGTIDFTIAKKKITSFNQAKEIQYMGSDSYIENYFEENVDGYGIAVKYCFTGKNVGSTMSSIELVGTHKNNYELVSDSASATIVKRPIILKSTNTLMVYKFGDGWKNTFRLDKDNFVELITGDQVNVTITMNNGSYAVGNKFDVYAGTTITGVETATISGRDADNYVLKGNAKVLLAEKSSEILGNVKDNENYTFGNTGSYDTITWGDKSFTVYGEQGCYIDLIDTTENKDKQIAIKVCAGDKVIAKLVRSGVEGVNYVYSGGVWKEEIGGPATVTFYLLKNVDGYTDAEGRWIYEGDEINLIAEISVEEIASLTINSPSNTPLTALAPNKVYKVTSESEGEYSFEFTKSGNIEIEVKIYSICNDEYSLVNNGTTTGESIDEYANGNQDYYIYITLVNGEGSVRITFMEVVE